MPSARNEDRLLDAARETILAVGWRRTTLTEIARRAGLSRMTIYRSYPDTAGILADLMTREWTEIIDRAAEAAAEEGDPLERVARTLVRAVEGMRGNELFRRIVTIDPEMLLPYLLDRRGRAQDTVLQVLVGAIDEAQQAGAARDGDPELLGRSVMLAAQGFLVTAQIMTDAGHTEEQLDQELRDLVRRYLRR